MDLRDIQRLHAQFAPDTMTIDLPRQIAALPGPSDFAPRAPAASVRARTRWAQTGPLLRGSIIAVAIAAIVGMAGMGAAALYKSTSNAHVGTPAGSDNPTNTGSVHTIAAPTADLSKLKDIDAAPAQPLINAPGLSASELTDTPTVGLTSDQFRKSLRATDTPVRQNTPATPSQLTAESERAAVSPIHRSAPLVAPPAIAPLQMPVAPVLPITAAEISALTKSADPVAVQQVSPAPVSASPIAPSQPTQTNTAASAAAVNGSAAPAKPPHPARHRVSKPLVEQYSGGESPAAPKPTNKTAPITRAGSNEVQMF